jgi:hypothetical protein
LGVSLIGQEVGLIVKSHTSHDFRILIASDSKPKGSLLEFEQK